MMTAPTLALVCYNVIRKARRAIYTHRAKSNARKERRLPRL